MKIITVLKSGGEYEEKHVHKLRDMCKKHAPGYEFECLTDMDPDCQQIGIQDNWPGWWSKIELFKLEGPRLFFDLDTIITNDITYLIEKARNYQFCILRDWKPWMNQQHKTIRARKLMNSGMMSWTRDQWHIYKAFKERPEFYMNEFNGDQDYIQDCIVGHQVVPLITNHDYSYAYFNDLSKKVANFKHDTKSGEINNPKLHEIIIFQGNPRPWAQNKIPY